MPHPLSLMQLLASGRQKICGSGVSALRLLSNFYPAPDSNKNDAASVPGSGSATLGANSKLNSNFNLFLGNLFSKRGEKTIEDSVSDYSHFSCQQFWIKSILVFYKTFPHY
jgi:hypothetical protein